jgi:P4 family phage/plasmid primase-like protien
MKITLFTAKTTGNAKNCLYPTPRVITCEEEMVEAVAFDHVCAAFTGSYRSLPNFRNSDVDVMDNDNDHSDDPSDWIYPEDYESLLENVSYIVVPSRHNMKPKDGKSARPRNHVYFPHDPITSAGDCAALKKAILERFPFFDKGCADAARFIFGNMTSDIIWHEGELNIDCLVHAKTTPAIPQGQRNNTMSRFAGRVVKRYGATERAHEIFLDEAQKCNPPLDDEELSAIWHSACKFAKKVQSQQGYVSPEEYEFQTDSLKPDDYSDIGQARVIAREYGDELIHTSATDILRYNGVYWEESKQKAVGAVIEFLDLQLADADDTVRTALSTLVAMGISEAEAIAGGKKFMNSLDEEQLKQYEIYLTAKTYKAFVMKRRDMKYIVSALQTLKPMVDIPVSQLDASPFLINTPGATYDVRYGIKGARPHDPDDKITKVTTFDPSDKGKDMWIEAVNSFFCSDAALIDYVQQMMGLSILGKVFIEALMIAYGEGGNGKSTFGNAILKVLGSFGGVISADALTVGCKRNVKPELAETKGKRLLIAAELEEGMRLNTSMVKQLCSTDEIEAEKKYKDPFHFTPTHTLLLYTNHLPKVGAMDDGIWRRLIVIPFNAKIKPKKDVKNYADYLVENAGEYIMKWLIEGAEKIIKHDFHIETPGCVLDAVSKYRRDNDWLSHYLDECCDVDEKLQEKSGAVYSDYRAFCLRTGEFTRSTTEFYNALEQRGFKRVKRRDATWILGLKLRDESIAE